MSNGDLYILRDIFPAVPVRYEGRDATFHELDLHQFGESAKGLARLLGAVAHFALHHKIVRKLDALDVRVVARAPRASSFELVATAQAALQHPLVLSAASGLFAALAALVPAWLAQKKERHELLDLVRVLIQQNGASDERQRDRLMAMVERLIESLRPAARSFVTPVGDSCEHLTIGPPSGRRITLDRVDRDVIDASPDAVVSEEMDFVVLISELDMATGGCRVGLKVEPDRRYRGEIIDPQVKLPRNPYVLAMANRNPIQVRAKTLTEDGVIRKLFISDIVTN